jgi:hypothetical protein
MNILSNERYAMPSVRPARGTEKTLNIVVRMPAGPSIWHLFIFSTACLLQGDDRISWSKDVSTIFKLLWLQYLPSALTWKELLKLLDYVMLETSLIISRSLSVTEHKPTMRSVRSGKRNSIKSATHTVVPGVATALKISIHNRNFVELGEFSRKLPICFPGFIRRAHICGASILIYSI